MNSQAVVETEKSTTVVDLYLINLNLFAILISKSDYAM